MKRIHPIVVIAYATYPEIASSEGIVNQNWITIIKKQGAPCFVQSAFSNTVVSSAGIVQQKKNKKALKMYNAVKMPNSFKGIVYRLYNKIKKQKRGFPIHTEHWIATSKQYVLEVLNAYPEAVIWVRTLPIYSIASVLDAYQKRSFPIVININDPVAIDHGVVNKAEQQLFIASRSITQCWTFPSHALAVSTAKRYDLDMNRCFVIPHAMENQKKLYDGNTPHEKLNFIYTGTFYKSAFTEVLQEGLQAFSKCEEAQKTMFTFILSQYNQDALQWIDKTIVNPTVHTKLQREEVLDITGNADCMIVVDAASHKHLLKGKLVEAMSFGLPILGITYKGSVMDTLVKEYGGFCMYQDDAETITQQLITITQHLTSQDWITTFCEKRSSVLKKISEEAIYKMTQEVTEYARHRYNGEEGSQKTLVTPLHLNWP